MDDLINQRNRDEEEFPPISLIDVVFMLLIFFFLTSIVITGRGKGIVGGEHEETGPKALDLPAASIDARITKEKKEIDGIRILIQKSKSNLQVLEYFLLGYDNEEDDPDKRNITEEDLDFAKAWKDSIELDPYDENDSKLINSNRFIHKGYNYIERDGTVPSENDSIEKETANLKLFFKRIKKFDKFKDISALYVEIKADESANIGFINDIMTICGADSIPKISFILKKKFKP